MPDTLKELQSGGREGLRSILSGCIRMPAYPKRMAWRKPPIPVAKLTAPSHWKELPLIACSVQICKSDTIFIVQLIWLKFINVWKTSTLVSLPNGNINMFHLQSELEELYLELLYNLSLKLIDKMEQF